MFDFPGLEPQESATYPPEGTRPALGTGDWLAKRPLEAWERQKRGQATQHDVEIGETLFNRFCAVCHGRNAMGVELSDDYEAPDLTETDYAAQTGEDIYTMIVEGGLNMPSYGEVLSEPECWLVVNHLRILQRKQ